MGKLLRLTPVMIGLLIICKSSSAYEFDTGLGDLHVSWVSNITGGVGIRLKNPSCALTGDPDAWNHCGTAADVNDYGFGTDGNLNYRKGQLYTGYLGVTSEVMLTMPNEGWQALVRATAMYDFAASHTERTPLSTDAFNQAVRDGQLLDAWVQKNFNISDQRAHVRVGNQVINWGESYFASSGINATNSLDIQKLLIPGTQLKQALLPAPMVSFATSLPKEFSLEAYYQLQWNGNRYPPVGTYWSTTDIYGRGAVPINGMPVINKLPSNTSPEYGVRLGYQPKSLPASFALYYEEYTDKSPVPTALSSGALQWSYPERRQLYGASSNFQIGDWAFGAEVSYRPHDAVLLSSCYSATGPAAASNVATVSCPEFIDRKKIQYVLNGQINLTPTTQPWIKLLGADGAVFTAEISLIDYLNFGNSSVISRTIEGQQVYQTAGLGTGVSAGATVDFNWSYDGTVIPGWLVTPGITYSQTLTGFTPTFNQNYLTNAKSINVYVLFAQNPQVWQGGINFTTFFGGTNLSQPYADRNTVGLFVTRNF